MTWLALRLLLKRIPGVAWVILFAVAFLAVGVYGIYHHGRAVEKREAHRIALVDSATKAHTLVRIATAETERQRGAAVVATRRSTEGRVKRQAVRAEVEPLLASLPEPVLRLIHTDDEQIRRDSVTITAHAAADSAWMVERDRRIAADTVEAHQAELPSEAHHGHRLLYAIGGAIVAVVVTLAVHR